MPGKPADRRRNKRQRRRLDVRFWNDKIEGRGFTTNVSDKGMLIETSKTLPVGERVHLEVLLPESSFFAEGVVVRRKTYPAHARALFKPCVAVQLVGLREVIRSIAGGPTPAAEARMRVDLSDPAELERVYSRDIKYGGLLVHTAERPQLDSEISVPVLLPEPHGEITCRGTVVKLSEDPPSVALRLADVDQVRGRLVAVLRPD